MSRTVYIANPQSTFFNVFYAVPGLLAVALGVDYQAWALVLFGIAMLVLTWTSAGYHATQRTKWKRADISSIFATFFLGISYQLSTFPIIEEYWWWLSIIFVGLSVAMAFTYEDWSHTQIGVLVIINMALLFIRVGAGWQFWICVGFFLAGLFVQRYAERFPKSSDAYDIFHSWSKPLWATGLLFLIL